MDPFLVHVKLKKDMRANHSQSWKDSDLGERWLNDCPDHSWAVSESLNPAAHVLPMNFNFLRLTKMVFGDSTEMVTSLVENTGNKRPRSPATAPIRGGNDRGSLGTSVSVRRWRRHCPQGSFICCLRMSCQQSWGMC